MPLALASESSPAASFDKNWFKGWQPNELVSLIGDQMGAIQDLRSAYGHESTAFTRMGDGIVDAVLAVGSGFAVPLFLEAFPKWKRVGRGSFYIDTHAIVAAGVLIAGTVMVTLGKDGGRTVLACGQGIASGYAAVKATALGREWFGQAQPMRIAS